MSDESRGYTDAAQRLVSAARAEARKAVDAAFAAGRPVHEAGTGFDSDVTYRVYPDGRRERIGLPEEQGHPSRSARIA